MASRSDAVIPDLQKGITELRTTVDSLTATVTTPTSTVAPLVDKVKGLMATSDGGVYGDTYAGDYCPAVRAHFVEQQTDRIHALEESIAHIHDSIAHMTVQSDDNLKSLSDVVANTLKIDNEVKDLRGSIGASVNGVPTARKEKKGVTEMNRGWKI